MSTNAVAVAATTMRAAVLAARPTAPWALNGATASSAPSSTIASTSRLPAQGCARLRGSIAHCPPLAVAHRHFSSSRSNHAADLRDEDIPSRMISLVLPEGGLSEKPVDLRKLLRDIDRKESFVVQVAEGGEGRYPICKIINKKAAYEKAKDLKNRVRSKTSQERNKKMNLQLTWLVTENDLEHKVKTASRHFHKRGKKGQVEIVIVTRKGMKAGSMDQKQAFVARLHEKMTAIEAESESASDEAEEGKQPTAPPSRPRETFKVQQAREAEWQQDHKVTLIYEAV
ncbi:hypothetical protein BDZ90DRAFT_20694 [Jaminaea rosea]|uniref:Translation initiation factor 3 N-terminal domain-containing protein n=1 Tax=Jaminaea rosea TaxID=1569628 RepID=A0A316V3C3_9BASI|nr:hypothetical protein BDZ90DRAFT_20694 [Jaminaea rosea]PWN30693.1 hypothetical protein BDZ90DRAFT_20694 [Jaminaea rosea]